MAMSEHQNDPNTDRIISIIREMLYVVYFLDYIMMFEFIFEMQSAMLTLSSHSWDQRKQKLYWLDVKRYFIFAIYSVTYGYFIYVDIE